MFDATHKCKAGIPLVQPWPVSTPLHMVDGGTIVNRIYTGHAVKLIEFLRCTKTDVKVARGGLNSLNTPDVRTVKCVISYRYVQVAPALGACATF